MQDVENISAYRFLLIKTIKTMAQFKYLDCLTKSQLLSIRSDTENFIRCIDNHFFGDYKEYEMNKHLRPSSIEEINYIDNLLKSM